jgi:hypothetical protein
MKWKLALIAMVLAGSGALVASSLAQQPPPPAPAVYVPSVSVEPAQPHPVPPLPPGGATVNSNGFYQVQPVGLGGGTAYVARWGTAPEEANFAHEADRLARQLGEAKSDTDRDKLKTKLGEVLEKQFDQRQKRHEHEIEQLEAQIKKLKDLVAKRQENRREIIGRRLEQILRESQGLGW